MSYVCDLCKKEESIPDNIYSIDVLPVNWRYLDFRGIGKFNKVLFCDECIMLIINLIEVCQKRVVRS